MTLFPISKLVRLGFLAVTLGFGWTILLAQEKPDIVPAPVKPKESVPSGPAKAAENPAPRPQRKPPEISRESAMLLYRPKTASNPKIAVRVLNLATRGKNRNPIRIVALAPASGGITVCGMPRLWWWQSHPTENDELEFSLSRVGTPAPLIKTRILKRDKAGYVPIDLSSPAINRGSVVLEPGVEYQWSVACLSEEKRSSVYVRFTRVADPILEQQVKEGGVTSNDLAKLSESGNWYELFDLLSTSASAYPDRPELAVSRTHLLKQIGLASELSN